MSSIWAECRSIHILLVIMESGKTPASHTVPNPSSSVKGSTGPTAGISVVILVANMWTHVATNSCSPAGVNSDHTMLLTGAPCPLKMTGDETVCDVLMSSIFHMRPV